MSTLLEAVKANTPSSLDPFLSQVRIRNYKSIGTCKVDLRRFTILVGRNGSGKSNFLDALRFVMEGLQNSLDQAFKTRGGIDEVRRRSTGHPRNFAIQLELHLSDWKTATYAFEIAARPQGGFLVKEERLRLGPGGYCVREGQLIAPTGETMPPVLADRLYLVNAAGLPQYRPIYDALINMGFYNLNPEVMKKPQSPDAGELLHRDGGNIASVMARLTQEQPSLKDRIQSYLATIVPGIVDVHRVPVGPWETMEFRQEVEGARHPWKFFASSMSDGTLRALGALVAVMQLAERQTPVRLVSIEEPESALHPAAAGALMDALREATCHTQVIVTTHSPDLLEEMDFASDQLFAVQSKQGNTEIGPLDKASRETISKHLYSPGELLRMDQLSIDPHHLEKFAQPEFVFDEADQ